MAQDSVVTGAAVAERPDESEIIARLRARDEAAFMELVDRHHAQLLRLARRYLHDESAAEEVVQETWLAVLNGIGRFEGRSSLRTWIFRILTNQAFTRRSKDARRELPFSALALAEAEDAGPTVEPERFRGFWPVNGTWRAAPQEWGQSPEDLAIGAETRSAILAAIDALPTAQATVITLRDVQGFTGEETAEALGITLNNQRVLLHRARAKVRAALERQLRR
jgi:RNA polymerase sigma-70 factor (ECF subfamily)